MPVKTETAIQSKAMLNEWKNRLDSLLNEVQSWVQSEPQWHVEQSQAQITEKLLGSYAVDTLTIEDSKGRRLRLEPIARVVLGGEGIVELYAWPTLNRVRLLPETRGSGWRVLTDSGIELHQPWNRDNFITLAKDLMAA